MHEKGINPLVTRLKHLEHRRASTYKADKVLSCFMNRLLRKYQKEIKQLISPAYFEEQLSPVILGFH